MISFILNDKIVHTNSPIGSTLLDFIRYQKHLTGTKIGCREGDCGACTVLIGDIQDNEVCYQSMTSCLTPLGNIQAKHVLTVEGINMPKLSPVQQLMVDNNGTQCGFCTTGFIMSLTGFVLSNETPTIEHAIKAIDGNICRCTGYKSIERAAQEICRTLASRPTKNRLSWLADNGFVPAYLKDIQLSILQIRKQKGTLPPSSGDDAKGYLIGGGTDLMVQKPEILRKATTHNVLDNEELKGIKITNGRCIIGAATTVTEFENSEVIRNLFPDIDNYMKLVSSSPIRNMATLGGNLVNASPIGDMTIFFLALGSSVMLNKGIERRTLPLKSLYLGYKTLDKTAEEFIESIQFPIPDGPFHFNFEKVSKRTHLDIASVNAACQLQLNKDGSIALAHLAAGGVAAVPKYLHKSSAFLVDKKVDEATLTALITIINSEIAPISDARGSAEYKRLLLRQLVVSHFIQFFGPVASVSKVLNA